MLITARKTAKHRTERSFWNLLWGATSLDPSQASWPATHLRNGRSQRSTRPAKSHGWGWSDFTVHVNETKRETGANGERLCSLSPYQNNPIKVGCRELCGETRTLGVAPKTPSTTPQPGCPCPALMWPPL